MAASSEIVSDWFKGQNDYGLRIMNLKFDISLARNYTSQRQVARVLTEDWLAKNMYCPVCGAMSIQKSMPNLPVNDFVCHECRSQYELKSKRTGSASFQASVADGVYRTMISRITSFDNPNFFFLHYDRYEVNNLVIVPKFFFTPDVIAKRQPLSSGAHRAGWEGCDILLKQIPQLAKIPIVTNGIVRPHRVVVEQYNAVAGLRTKSMETRGWLLEMLRLIERLDNVFTLKQLYAYVGELSRKHPGNNHIHDKIRQQLQLLRDKGIIDFVSRGVYKKVLVGGF